MRATDLSAVRRNPTVLLLPLLLLTAPLASGQTMQGEPADLQFQVINATTGQPGGVQRMTIDYVRARRNGVLDFEPVGATFTAPAVPIVDGGEYIVTVWSGDVPYWWSLRGHQLKGQVTKLHVFDTTTDLDGLQVTGLNLVIRRQEGLLNLEYMIQIENTRSPQVTVFDPRSTLELEFPSGVEQIAADYTRGPDPTAIPIETGSRRARLGVPLTPGTNRIRLTAAMPWREGLEVPVGADLPIASWSVLASPDWLEVKAMDLVRDEAGVAGFSRFTGPALPAGRAFVMRLASGEHAAGAEEDLFTQSAPDQAAPAAAERDTDGRGLPLPFVFAGVLIIIVLVAFLWRRRH